MASSRDLVAVFVAFELLSIPTYLLAAWRKRDEHSNEAGVKYFLMGVFATGVLVLMASASFAETADAWTGITRADQPSLPVSEAGRALRS